MRLVVLVACIASGCGGGTTGLVRSGEGTRGDPAETIVIARDHPPGVHYERTLAAWLSNNGAGRAFRFEARATSEVSPDPAGGFTEELRFAPLEMSGPEGRVDPLPSEFVGLERVRMSMRVATTNAVVDGPTHSGDGPSASFIEELIEVLRNIRVVFPDRPLRIGERWEGPAIAWDTRPLGLITLEWRPAWILESVEDGVAHVRWDGALGISPFRMFGLMLEGAGSVRGITNVSLEDGTSGNTDLDIEVGLRPAGGGISALTVRAKFLEEVRRAP